MYKHSNIYISCIMSNYNTDESMLRASINSILNQTYTCFELIIVDDFSTNGTLAILEDFQKRDNRIRIIKNEKNLGLAASLNRGIAIAGGDVIARMDSDDIALKDRFYKQIKFLQKHPDIDICGTYAKMIGAEKKFCITPFIGADECKCQLLFSTCLIHPSVMIRKSFLDKYHLLYDEKYLCTQDYDMWVRCAEYGKVSILDEVCLLYRIHNKQASTAKVNLQQNYAIEICKRQLEKIGVSDLSIDKVKILCGFKQISLEDIDSFGMWIEEICSCSESRTIYNKDVIHSVLIYRYAILLLKARGSLIKKMSLIAKSNLLRKCRVCIIVFKNVCRHVKVRIIYFQKFCLGLNKYTA